MIQSERFETLLKAAHEHIPLHPVARCFDIGHGGDSGVDFGSYQENIDTTTARGEMIFTVMASLAQFEGALISQRVAHFRLFALRGPDSPDAEWRYLEPHVPPHKTGGRHRRYSIREILNAMLGFQEQSPSF